MYSLNCKLFFRIVFFCGRLFFSVRLFFLHPCFLRACFFCSYFLHRCFSCLFFTCVFLYVFFVHVFCFFSCFSVRGVYPLLFYAVIFAGLHKLRPVAACPIAGFDKFIFSHLRGSVLRSVNSYCERSF